MRRFILKAAAAVLRSRNRDAKGQEAGRGTAPTADLLAMNQRFVRDLRRLIAEMEMSHTLLDNRARDAERECARLREENARLQGLRGEIAQEPR